MNIDIYAIPIRVYENGMTSNRKKKVERKERKRMQYKQISVGQEGKKKERKK